MNAQTVPSYPVQIFIAGDPHHAEKVCRDYCFDTSLCVTVTPTFYVYKGGAEQGVVVGLINYPRFPKSTAEIAARAQALGELLMHELRQTSFTIQTPVETHWFSRREAA